MMGLMYPLESVFNVRMTRNHEAVVKGLDRFLGRKYDYTPVNDLERQYAYLPGRDAGADSRARGAVRHPRPDRAHGHAQRRAQVAHRRQRRVQQSAAGGCAGAESDGGRRRGAARTWRQRHHRSHRRRRVERSPGRLRRDDGHGAVAARRVRRSEQEQRRDLHGRSPRPGRVGVRCQRRQCGSRDRSRVPEPDDGYAADARGRDGRPRDRQPQRPRGRNEADRA